MRNPQYPHVPFLFCLGALFLFLASCTAQPESPSAPTFTVTSTPIQTLSPNSSTTPVPSATTTPATRPTSTTAPTKTPIPTTTLKPVNWLVNWEISDILLERVGHYFNWENETTLKVYLDGDEYLIHVHDGDSEITKKPPEPTITPAFPNLSSFSPKRNFAVECAENQLTLYKMPERTALSQFEGKVAWCPLLRWKSDETAVTFISLEGKAYIWKIDGTAPKEIGTGTPAGVVSWSPNETKLLTLNYIPDAPDELVLTILYPDGRPMKKTDIRVYDANNWTPEYVHWVTEKIVTNGVFGNSYSSVTYYNIQTGEELLHNSISLDWDFKPSNQEPQKSPDGHWTIFDQSNYRNHHSHEYVLLDFEKARTYLVADEVATVLDFAAWSEDNSRLFITIRHTKPAFTAHDLQLGFQTFDPDTRQFTSIIPHAMYAMVNIDQRYVFVLTEDFEQRSTYATIFTIEGIAVTQPQLISSTLHYLNPGEGLPIPATWSNDGTQIVFSDVWGDLWLADMSGSLIQLADNLGFDPAYPHQPKFSWSPDDSHLLITFNDRAWVITVP